MYKLTKLVATLGTGAIPTIILAMYFFSRKNKSKVQSI